MFSSQTPMPVSLIVGPPNSGRAPALRERLFEALDRDPVLVVPTGDDAAAFERELCRDGGGAMLGVSIRTFASLLDAAAAAAELRMPPSLSEPQRLALVRAAVGTAGPKLLARSAERAGFVPALDALIAELQAGLVFPADLDAAAAELDDPDYERELAKLYSRYVELRDRADRSDAGSRALATVAAIRVRPEAWGDHPVLVYGFDDFSAVQTELLAALGRVTDVLIAVAYEDREALNVLAPLRGELEHDLGAAVTDTLESDPGYTDRPSLRHLDRWLFEPAPPRIEPDAGVAMLECAGELGEAEAVGAEVARLLADGARPDDIAIVARDAEARGPAIGRTLARFDIPVAVEASVALDRTAVGRSLVALCKAASPQGEPADLLAHLRADPALGPGVADWLERRIRRERPATVDEAVAGWEHPPRHLAAVRAAGDAPRPLRALAALARDLAEAPHRGRAPVVAADGERAPFEPLELRAAATAAELLEELAQVGELPGCEPTTLGQAAEAIAGSSVPLWRGPADGRVRILDPQRVRAGRARYLFCVGLQEGELPRRGTQQPLLSDERRARLGFRSLARRDPHDWERYLFHACVSRPTERLYLCWQACDDDGVPSARSPFVDEVLDLFVPDPVAAGERLIRKRGLERTTFNPGEAPSERELARALAIGGRDGDPREALAALAIPDDAATRVLAALEQIPDPSALPGPLAAEPVLADLGSRRVVSASSLEKWLECSYRWFVDHELQPQRLDPEPDPLRLGTVAHQALQRLYAEPPGDDAIPRPGDLGRWRRRAAELIDGAAAELGMRPGEPPDSVALARLRAQIERFLASEAEIDTALRPRPELLEARFGFDDAPAAGLDLGGAELRGAIDRIDVAADGRRALVRDYKTSSKVPGRGSWESAGKLQLQLYTLAARESIGLEPIGGIYHPLGGRGKDRRPRGLLVKGSPEVEGWDLVRGDPCDADEFEAELERARAQAAANAEAMRRGAIDRDPLGGTCPRHCTYQAICRIERAVGLEDEGRNGEDGA